MFTTSACAMPTISRTSSCACAITGDAPAASSTLALKFMATRFVMLCTSGDRSRTAAMSAQRSEEVSVAVISVLVVSTRTARQMEDRDGASLRWHDPDQVPRVFLSPAFAAPDTSSNGDYRSGGTAAHPS